MKNNIFLSILLIMFLLPAYSGAENFMGAPVIPEGTIIAKSDSKLELQTELTHNDALDYYKETLKGLSDIKYRDWKDSTYIEDDGNRAWHSITIYKEGERARVIIVKDSWTWIIGTLVLRYIGVFIVLMLLLVGMTVSGKIISTLAKRAKS